MITATISTYNREKYLPQVLDSLLNQTLSKDLFEVVLVDNNSPGNTKEISDAFEKAHSEIKFSYHLEKNQGLSYGRNRGIKEGVGKYITFIDDDAFLEEDYLEKIYNYFEQDKNCSAIGSKIHLHYEDVIPNWENKYLNSLLGYFDMGDEERQFPKSDYPRGSNMSFRMDVFNQVGGFNVELGRKGGNLAGSEEKDMFQKIYKNDLKVIYIPDAMVYHCVPIERTTKDFIKRQGIGTGKGEWQRVKDEGGLSPIKRLFIEFLKWNASFILLFFYAIQLKWAKGWMILRFRAWVTQGLFTKSELK